MAEYRHQTQTQESGRQAVRRIVSVVFLALVALLVLRIIFKVLGANDDNAFTSLIYGLTGWMVAPFASIFPEAAFTGISQGGVFEPGALIAVVVLLIVCGLILRFIAPSTPETTIDTARETPNTTRTTVTEDRVRPADTQTNTHVHTETEHVEHHDTVRRD